MVHLLWCVGVQVSLASMMATLVSRSKAGGAGAANTTTTQLDVDVHSNNATLLTIIDSQAS